MNMLGVYTECKVFTLKKGNIFTELINTEKNGECGTKQC